MPRPTLFRAPGINNFDLLLVEGLGVHERVDIQFRAEAYNAFNHTQFMAVPRRSSIPAGQQVNKLFGQVTAARDPRIMQLGLRCIFDRQIALDS